jgi:hypothetical protein
MISIGKPMVRELTYIEVMPSLGISWDKNNIEKYIHFVETIKLVIKSFPPFYYRVQ